MLAKRIIVCMDVDGGRVVKGVKFVDIKDAGDPVQLAKAYNKQGADELVFLDITATSDNRGILIEVVKNVAKSIFIPFTVGGGIRSIDDIQKILYAGADKVSLNTAAVENPGLIEGASSRFGSQAIVLAIDAKRKGDGFEVYTCGGRKGTGMDVVTWARKAEKLGAGEILLTSMDRDGTKKGVDFELTQRVSEAVGIPVIASGGIGKSEDFVDAFRKGADAGLAASIFHFEELTVSDVKSKCREMGILVR